MEPLPQEIELEPSTSVVAPIKRGRPRKSTLLDVQPEQPAEELEPETTSEEGATKKRIGRPRKSDSQTVQVKAIEQIKSEETDTGSGSSSSNSNSPLNRRISNRLKKKSMGKCFNCNLNESNTFFTYRTPSRARNESRNCKS